VGRSQTGTQDLIRVVRSCRGVGEKPGQESRLLRINFPGVTTEIPFNSLPLDQSDVRYLHGPDSGVQEGVPSGTVTEFEWNDSAAYPGTSRRFWVYVPAQYDAEEPAALMVFLDGQGFLDPEDDVRSAIVLDNLIDRGDIPVTIGVFVEPGVFEDVEDPRGRKNRNAEYDAFDDRNVTFLLDEILPEVTKRWSISEDPERRGICGFSSGGNGAFTAAWLRPDAFGRIICFVSSFAQMPHGNPYPALIPDTPRKPLRVFMQASHRDGLERARVELARQQPSRCRRTGRGGVRLPARPR